MLSRQGNEGGVADLPDNAARSLALEFWANLNAGAPDEARAIARRIAPTPVESFTFPDPDGSGVSRGTSAGHATLDPGTPDAVASAWNSSRKVEVLQASAKWCRAPLSRGNVATGDFRICTVEGCLKTTHHDTGKGGKKTVVRMELSDKLGTILIVCPVTTSAVKQTSCFSRPCLHLSTYPPELFRLGRWEAILGLRLVPSAWRVIMEAYAAAMEAYRTARMAGELKPPSGDVKPPPEVR